MALFKVKARDDSVSLIVRARCITCARETAVNTYPASETLLWRDPNLSSVEVIYDTNKTLHDPSGKRCVLERTEYKT